MGKRNKEDEYNKFKDEVYAKFQEKAEEFAKTPCFMVIDFRFTSPDGDRSKICLVKWCADKGVKIKDKMLLASSYDALKSKLNGVHAKLQLSSLGEFDYDEFKSGVPEK